MISVDEGFGSVDCSPTSLGCLRERKENQEDFYVVRLPKSCPWFSKSQMMLRGRREDEEDAGKFTS